MERTGGEPDVVGYDEKRMNINFMIVQRKVLKGEEVFVTIGKQWNREKTTNRKTMPLTWQLPWTSNS